MYSTLLIVGSLLYQVVPGSESVTKARSENHRSYQDAPLREILTSSSFDHISTLRSFSPSIRLPSDEEVYGGVSASLQEQNTSEMCNFPPDLHHKRRSTLAIHS